ncbi:hypothetical protein RI543_004691 [Arxiozyma heterogenica]|uniref:Ribosome-recycling factor, mitochondrial n=1 Tax=Arxiozyma heterogenica TaxID=278026 RepID=A0AAN7WLG0_9SACH|nr:hypothetical protein RI543_004691 [Kazachstania heterogenica]
MMLRRVLLLPTSDFIVFSKQRHIHTTLFLNAKNKNKHDKGKKSYNKVEKDESIDIVDIQHYIDQAKSKFDKTLNLHEIKLNECKQGISNVHIFDTLKLANGTKFTEVATTTQKGKNMLLVSVFNPNDVKKVVSCILASGLNLTPEKMSNDPNEQMLKVTLPPKTKESRLQQVKELKQIFENFKNSNLNYSLGVIRRDYMNKLRKVQQNDDVKKCMKELEALHKDYVNKLQEQFKHVEKNILNS